MVLNFRGPLKGKTYDHLNTQTSQNIMTNCQICCLSSVCCHNSTDLLRHGLYKTRILYI